MDDLDKKRNDKKQETLDVLLARTKQIKYFLGIPC